MSSTDCSPHVDFDIFMYCLNLFVLKKTEVPLPHMSMIYYDHDNPYISWEFFLGPSLHSLGVVKSWTSCLRASFA